MEPFAKNITTPTFLNSCGRNVLDPIDCEPPLFNHVLLIEKEYEKNIISVCLFLSFFACLFVSMYRSSTRSELVNRKGPVSPINCCRFSSLVVGMYKNKILIQFQNSCTCYGPILLQTLTHTDPMTTCKKVQ